MTYIDTYVCISLGECVWIFAHHVGQMTHSHPIFGFCFSHHFIVFLCSFQIRFGRFAQLLFRGVDWTVIIGHEFHTALHHCAIITSSPILQQTTGWKFGYVVCAVKSIHACTRFHLHFYRKYWAKRWTICPNQKVWVFWGHNEWGFHLVEPLFMERKTHRRLYHTRDCLFWHYEFWQFAVSLSIACHRLCESEHMANRHFTLRYMSFWHLSHVFCGLRRMMQI